MNSGYSVVPAGHGHMRASTAERERAVDVLKAGFAEGRLDQEEYVDRVERAYRSKTYAELAVLIADLPVGPLGAPVPMVLPAQEPPSLPRSHRQPVSGLAITALILGLAAFPTLGLTAIPAVALGIVAMITAAATGTRGTLIAIIGALAGAASLPLLMSVNNLSFLFK